MLPKCNKDKINLKEPDLRIYNVGEDGKLKDEIIALWCNATKTGKKVLSGKILDQKVVGFINATATEENKRPYFTVYWSEEKEQAKEDPKKAKSTEKKQETKEEETDDLPF